MVDLLRQVIRTSKNVPVTALIPPSGADPPAPPAVRGGAPDPEHLPHAGGRHQLLPASQQQDADWLQDQHPAGLHPLQGQHH